MARDQIRKVCVGGKVRKVGFLQAERPRRHKVTGARFYKKVKQAGKCSRKAILQHREDRRVTKKQLEKQITI